MGRGLGWLRFVALTTAASAAVGCYAGGEDGSGSHSEAVWHDGPDECEFVAVSHGIVTEECLIPVDPDVDLLVVRKYGLRALLRHPRRAILMLPATLVTHVIWNSEIEDAPEYDALDRAAREGYFAYSLDWEGYGGSSQPENGRDVVAERMLTSAGDLIEWIRDEDHIGRVDLMGSSLGSALAVALGGRMSPISHHHVGKIVLTAHAYKEVTEFASTVLLSPEIRALFESIPDGYIDTAPFFYGPILSEAEDVPTAFCEANCPGRYAVGPTLEGFDLPVFDAREGRAPMLQFWGDRDLITPFSDVERFQAEYRGRGRAVVLADGGHVPHWETVRDLFWEETFDFLGRRGRGDH